MCSCRVFECVSLGGGQVALQLSEAQALYSGKVARVGVAGMAHQHGASVIQAKASVMVAVVLGAASAVLPAAADCMHQ